MSQSSIATLSLAIMAISSVINTVTLIYLRLKKPEIPKAGGGTIHLGGRL